MSKNVVDAVIQCDNSRKIFGLIPSRRQIEGRVLGSGYVNKWCTEDFVAYSDQVQILRDHGGPSQGKNKDDGMLSFEADIGSGLKFLHIDPWKVSKTIEEASEKTVSLIQVCDALGKGNVAYEIGTESAIYEYGPKELSKFLDLTKRDLGTTFDKVVYCVVQSGTKVREMRNVGSFNEDVARQMCNIVHDYGLFAKEHNSDYLTSAEISDRKECGVDSFNVAPEMGVLETKSLMEILLQVDVSMYQDFLALCYDSKSWEKWVDRIPSKEEAALICGHYNFSNQKIVEMKDRISQILSFDVEKHLQEKILERLHRLEASVR